MTGVVKSVGKYALLAGTALALSISVASAASLTKAGMDKRVADLEREVTLLKNQMKSAMMAKKGPDKNVQSGNSRVKVTLYGWVNKAVRFASTPSESAVQVIDNSHSGSRLGVRAVGSLNKNLTGVALIEADFRANHRHGTGFDSPVGGQINIRHTVGDLIHKDLGTLSLGHGWVAGGFSHSGSFAGTGGVFGIWGPDGDGVKATKGNIKGKTRHGMTTRGFPTLFGGREDRLLYRTPNLMGVSVEVSYNEQESWSAMLSISGLPGVKAVGVRLNAGYASDPDRGDNGSTSLAVSAGVQHTASGFSINGVYDQEQYKGGVKPTAWMADASWTGKMMDAGATSVTIGYGKWTDGIHGESSRYHFAVNQNVDSAAADVYFGVSHDTGDVTHEHEDPAAADNPCGAGVASCAVSRDGMFIILSGVRIKF